MTMTDQAICEGERVNLGGERRNDRGTHSELDKVDRAGEEAADSNHGEDSDETERVAVEGESGRGMRSSARRAKGGRGDESSPERLGEQHGPNESSLRRVEA